MIFAAGLGTRLRPLTDTRPKALVEIGGRTLLDITISRLREAGCGRIVVNVHHFAQMIADHIARHYAGEDILISDESDLLLDTGGGLRHALPLFESTEPILIHNVDILHNADLRQFHRQATEKSSNTAALLVSPRQTTRYLLFDTAMRLTGWTNTATGETRGFGPPDHSLRYAFSGIHIVSPAIAKLLDQYATDHGDVFGITPFYIEMASYACFRGIIAPSLRLLDVGKIETIEKLNHTDTRTML